MTSKIFRLLSLGVVLLTAIACSLSDDDATATTAAVSGSLDEDLGTLSKSSASTELEAFIEYTDGTVVEITINSDYSFSFNATAGVGFFLTFYSATDAGNNAYLSRYFGALTAGSSTSGDNAVVNAVTSEHSERIKTLVGFTAGSALSDLTALSGFVTQVTDMMFGSGGTFSATGSGLVASFISLINDKIALIAIFDPTNIGTYFTDIAAIDNASETITFESGTTTGTAAVGVVTAFSFPQAESTLTGENVSYTATVGNLDVSVDSTNRLVKFIPSADLIGTTVTLTVTASSGRTSTGTFSATITVTDLSISGEDLFTLNDASAPYSLKYGPVSDGTNFYVVADKDGTYTIEKYAMSDLSSIDTTSGVQNLSTTSTYAMARSFSDMIITGDVAYVVDSLSGIVKYDLTSTSTTSYTSTTANFTASTLALAGTTLLAYNSSEDTLASLDTSSSTATAETPTLSGTTLDSRNDIGSVGNYFYISGSASGNYGYDFYNSSFTLQSGSFTSAYDYEFEQDASGISTSFYGISNSTPTVIAVSFTNSTVVTESFTNSLAYSTFGISAINGSTLLTNSFSATGNGISLISSDNVTGTEQNTQDDYPVLDYVSLDTVEEAYAMVINLPEGEAVANTTSRFFSPVYGFTSTTAAAISSSTPTWFLKSYNMTSVTAE